MPQILIVDDDPQVRDLFGKILRKAGYLVSQVGSAREALQALDEQLFDLLIVDLSLPDMDGFELLQIIRGEAIKARVLLISGFFRGSLPHLASKLGADATIDKASAPTLLLTVVHELVG